jgi:hypothetical protein
MVEAPQETEATQMKLYELVLFCAAVGLIAAVFGSIITYGLN